MAKRVLGNDPFATGGGGSEPPDDEKKREAPRASKRPGKASVQPSAKPTPSKRPGAKASRAPRVESREVEVPRAPGVPTDLGSSEDEASGVVESAAPADLPPDLQRVQTATVEAEPVERAAPAGEMKAEIRDLEAELDKLLHEVARKSGGKEALGRVAEQIRAEIQNEESESPSTPPSATPREDQNVFDVARELLSSDYYLRQWGRVAMRDRSEEVDEFGLDPKYEARMRPFFDFLYERWFRVETQDIDRVPASGRVILCANHSGAVPYDGAMLATALRREHPTRRELRWLAEDFVFYFPFLGVFMNRIGAVRACQENAERLLKKSSCVGVFPEGVKGISKLFRDRYRLQRFGRGGHVKLALRTRTPIVPVAIVGAEETHPMIAPTGLLAKFLGVPYVPLTPTFPLLGPLGLVPLPTKWKIHFLDPIAMEGYGPEAADDEVLVGRLNEKIRGIIQEELDRVLRERRSVFRG